MTPTTDLLARLRAPTEPFTPPRPERLSTRCAWFADDDRLVLVTRTAGSPADAEHALAYGLAYSADRDLWIVTDAPGASLITPRLPWLAVPIEVFVRDGTDATPVLAPAKREVVDRYADPVAAAVVQLGERAAWVAELVAWADAARGLRPAPRSQYLAWHCDGRQVLAIRKQRGALRVVAGVDSKHQFEGSPSTVVVAEGPLSPAQTLRLIESAARAAAERLEGNDIGHREHLLQSRLDPSHLGLIRWRREFPATRPGSKRAFIDFLGVDGRGDIHVVETKIGPDERLVLQGLDYWIWATAHAHELRREFRLDELPRVHIDFVVAEKEDAFTSIYTPAQVEALDGEVSWRFHTVTGWEDGAPSVHRTAFGVVPGAPRRAGGTPPRWAQRLDTHLRAWASEQEIRMRTTRHVKSARDVITPRAQPAYGELEARGLLHRQITHLRSSQAFALNLLAPLDGNAWASILSGRVPFNIERAQPAEFEFQDLEDHLGEATSASPHTTQTDALVMLDGPGGTRHAVLIEVKLTEPQFGSCSAWASAQNDRREVCAASGPFGGDPERCFQLANHDRSPRRTYDTYLGPLTGPSSATGCWFREANQIMRNVALARVLITRGRVASACVALVAPVQHRSIWRQWRTHTASLRDVPGITFLELPAEEILTVHDEVSAAELRERYLPAPDHDESRHQVDGLQARLDRLFHEGGHLVASGHGPQGDARPTYSMMVRRPVAAVSVSGEPLLINADYPNTLTYPWPAGLDRMSTSVTVELAPPPRRRVLTNDLRDLTEVERSDLAVAAEHVRRQPVEGWADIDPRWVIR